MKKPWIETHTKVKCDCTHYPKDHHNGEGRCSICGCTWYYPNINYIKKQKKKNV